MTVQGWKGQGGAFYMCASEASNPISEGRGEREERADEEQ